MVPYRECKIAFDMIVDLYLLCVISVDVKIKCCKLCRLLDKMYGALAQFYIGTGGINIQKSLCGQINASNMRDVN